MSLTHRTNFKNIFAGTVGPGLLLLSMVVTTAVTQNVAHAEVTHDSTRSLRTSRPAAGRSSSARLNDLVSACLAGRPAALGNDPIDNTNVGAFDPGAVVDPGILDPGSSAPIGPDGGSQTPPTSALNEDDGGAVNGQAVFQAKCSKCHSGREDEKFGGIAKITLAITSGGTAVGGPPPMKATLAGLSTAEKTALLQFMGGR